MTCMNAFVSHYPGNASCLNEAIVFVIIVIVTNFITKEQKTKRLITIDVYNPKGFSVNLGWTGHH